MAGWLGVVQAEHVARALALGIAQVNHGKRSGLARMRAGDWLVYYSPHHRLGEHSPLQAFTAVGRLPDDEIWQADEGTFRPFRRRAEYRTDARHAPLADLRDRLHLTADPHWGYLLRRGLVPLTDHDVALVHEAMTGEPLPGGPPSVAPTASAGRVAAALPPAALW
jgi:hypothetical protein